MSPLGGPVPGRCRDRVIWLGLGGGRYEMRNRLLKSVGASVVIASVLVFLKPGEVTVANESTTASARSPALKTPWGEPDLQGIWTDETDTPLQRSAKYPNQEFFTSA